jgi:branched-chain amino acid transport system permease protein
MSTGDASPNLVDKLVAVKQTEWFMFLAVFLGILVFPWFLIEGLGLVADVIDTSIGGYTGLPAFILIFGIVVLGFNILLGYTGLLSFGHAAFFGGSAYTAAFLSRAGFLPELVAKSPILMIVVGTIVAVLLAWVIGFLSIRRSGVYFAVLTLTFGQIMYFYAMGPGAWLTNGDDGYTPDPGALLGQFPLGDAIPGDLITNWFYVLVGVTALLAIGAAYRILRSPYGLIFEALGQNEQRVNFVGLNVFRYKLMAFILSAAFAGVGGALYSMQTLTLHPNGSLYWIISGDFVIMTALGGVGTLLGPLVGAGVFEYIRLVLSGIEIFGFEFGPMWRLLLGGVFVVTVALFPNGIYGGIKGYSSAIVNRLGNTTGSGPERPDREAVQRGGDD